MANDPIQTQDGTLWYPRVDDNASSVAVSLYDVRAADDLRISYDFERDGWSIARGEKPDVEVAFVPAWDDQGPSIGEVARG